MLRERRKRRGAKRGTSRRDTDAKAAERRRRDLVLRRDVITASIEEAERRITGIDSRFCESGFFDTTPDEKVRSLQREREELRAEIDTLTDEWVRTEGELEE